jgi:tRNA A-37 threonylcarbamoyl transferase component Bud32
MLNSLLGDVHQLPQDDFQEMGQSQPEFGKVEGPAGPNHHYFGRYLKHPVRMNDGCDPKDLKHLELSFPELTDFRYLGKGGFGAVFSANQTHMKRRVAVKLLHAELALDERFVERFQKEACAQACVTHPNIVTVFDAGIRNERPYIIMEYVPGGTLRNRISCQPFSSREALLMLQQLCDALECSHSANLIHRDIKPENILIDQHGNLKLSDFGLARIVSEMQESERNIDHYYAGGTMNYMAPELMSRPWAADARTDLYAVIVVFYESIMGEIPRGSFEAPSSRSRMVRKLRKQVDSIVFRGLQSNPSRRFQTAIELRKHVDAIIEDPRLTKRVSTRSNNEDRRKYWLLVALFVMLAQLSVMGYFYALNVRRLDRQKAFTNQAWNVAKQKEEALVAIENELKKVKSQQEQRMSMVDPNEFNAIVKLSDDSAWLHCDFGAKDLSTDERLAIDRILSEMRQQYLRLELANTTQEVRPDETIVSTIRMSYEDLDQLEERLWFKIDGVVSVTAQKLLRDSLPLFVDCTSLVTEMPGSTDSKRLEFGKLITTDSSVNIGGSKKFKSFEKRIFPSKLRYPQLFGWRPQDTPIRISIRRKGMWFAWSIEQSADEGLKIDGSRRQTVETFRVVDNGESPIIPSGLRRFWWDPSTSGDKEARPSKQSSKAEIVSLRSSSSLDLPTVSMGSKKAESEK